MIQILKIHFFYFASAKHHIYKGIINNIYDRITYIYCDFAFERRAYYPPNFNSESGEYQLVTGF